jgi:alpha-1,3-mannosyltransferase
MRNEAAFAMRVLSITPTFFPQLGGLEQTVLDLALCVRDLGVKMDVAHVASGIDHVAESVRGVDVYRVPLWGNRVIGWAPALRSLARGYDLLHVHDPQLLAITANVRSTCGAIPAILSTHGGFWHTDRGYVLKKLYEATLLRGAAGHYRRVLATSIADFDYFKHYVDRISLCSNGVHVKRFNAVPSAGRKGLNRWIYWGRLSRNKRVDLIIDYAAHARLLGHPVELLICGRDFDQLMPELQAQVNRMQMGDAVRFEPFLDDAALRAELANRCVYITASEHEGFGLSVVEAMAAGLIVVCRDMSPLNRFVTRGVSGWLQRFDGSAQDLAAIGEFLSSPPEKAETMSSRARQAASEHDWDVVAPQFVKHYREVLSGDTPTREGG